MKSVGEIASEKWPVVKFFFFNIFLRKFYFDSWVNFNLELVSPRINVDKDTSKKKKR